MNTQPITSAGTLSVFGQNPPTRAYYAPAGTGTVIATAGASSGGTLNSGTTYALDGGATQASGTFTGAALGTRMVQSIGSVNGRFGAPINVPFTLTGNTTLSQQTYIPAFFRLEARVSPEAPPTFMTTDPQTAGAGQGSTVTFPVATAATQYAWLLTDRPIANIMVVTPFGNQPIVPDFTGMQTLMGQTLNVYGFTTLTVGRSVVLVIS